MNYLISSSFKRMTGIDFVNSAAANWRFGAMAAVARMKVLWNFKILCAA